MSSATDLFPVANPATPLAGRLRPKTIEGIVGQRHLLGPGKPLAVVKPYSRSFFSERAAMLRFQAAASSSNQGKSIVWPHGPAGTSTASSVPLRTVNRSGKDSSPPFSVLRRTVPR